MGYYDSTVASYDSQIADNRARINEYNERIKELEDDISELEALRESVMRVDEAVETAASNTSNKINNLPTVITTPFSLLKLNYFSSFLDVLKGTERIHARNGISDVFAKIVAEIRDTQNEIERLRGEINRCIAGINSLTLQRSTYITNTEIRIAQEAAAGQRAEATARQKALTGAAKKATTLPKTTYPHQTDNLPKLGSVISDIIKKR